MNSFNITGKLTRDPEVSTTNTGKTVAKFSVAVRKKFKRDGEPDADFVNCVAWGQTAEFVRDYITKGRDVAVSGRNESRQYVNKDGNKVTVWELNAESVEPIGGVRDDGQRQTTATVADDYDPFADQ